ncbi:MAG: hypothetical protein QGG42_17295 [Phycisphaerae bacterium]|jgi:hypothetical protein|nr:hypothetical protein [Phycisphaerae bacterium]
MWNPFKRKPKKEWVGESGYCNCLLVTMGSMRIPRIELSTKESLLSLEELTATRPDTHEWIKAQGFQYDKLDPLTIIRLLAEPAGISPETGCRTGTITAFDCVGDDEDMVERVFSMELRFDGEEPVLIVIQHGIEDAEQAPPGDVQMAAPEE